MENQSSGAVGQSTAVANDFETNGRSEPLGFSIITPSFRNSNWLKLCIRSVADQGMEHEHIVQDSCSDDGTQDWLPTDSRVRAFIEKDRGMYDAVNRGLRRAQGEILSYINCDEQYLPGALQAVSEHFRRNPTIQVVFADAVIVTPQGEYLCHRKACLPGKYHTLVSYNLAILTCATFFRRSILDDGLFFNPNLKDLGDADWVLRLIERRVPMGILRKFTSVFTETGVNMNLLPNAQREKKEFVGAAPGWARSCRPLFVWHYRLRKLLMGGYWQRPFQYAIYTKTNSASRATFPVTQPTTRWRR